MTPTPETAAAALPADEFFPPHSFGDEWDQTGVDVSANFPITKWLVLGALAGASVTLTSCGVADGAGGAIGDSGIWVDNLLKRLAESPVQVIVPMMVVGYLYGGIQAFAKSVSESRNQQVPPEQSATFRNVIIPAARGQGMDLEDPDQVKALAKTMSALRVVPSGEQPPFWSTLWERTKVFSQAEAGQWASSGVFLYITMVLMESINKIPPDSQGKWGIYAATAGAAYLTFNSFKEAIKPVKQ